MRVTPEGPARPTSTPETRWPRGSGEGYGQPILGHVVAASTEKDEIRLYAEDQIGEAVVHLEKVGSERVGPQRHDIWDVHCAGSRWWVLTNPSFFYSQADFKSRDVVLTFHVGLMLRVWTQRERRRPVAPGPATLLPGSWRRWEQAFESYDSGDEAENFQAVGARLRECLLSFVGETRSDELVRETDTRPKDGDFKGWVELLANHLASGQSSAKLRSYLKKLAAETWEYVCWLTHTKNAVRMDAEIGLKAVEHLLGTFTAARLRLARMTTRCEECGSYRMAAARCAQCGWVDPAYEPSEISPLSEDELAERLAEPCTPSSDIRRLSGRTT
jgi:hypothetical protein